MSNGREKALANVIEHYSYGNYSELIKKMEIYSTIAAKHLFEKRRHVSYIDPISHGLWMFIKTYIFKLGFLDGLDGFVISLMNAGGSFFKYAKALELMRNADNDHQGLYI